jgi:hypothetical protein
MSESQIAIGKVIGSARERLPFCGDMSVHLGDLLFLGIPRGLDVYGCDRDR